MSESLLKTREIEFKKQLILDEAAKLIDKVGFRNAKMEDIAKKVGFSKASLYSYFKDKDEIAMNIAKQHVLQFFNKISDLPSADLKAVEKLDIMKRAHMDFVKRSKNFIIIKPDFSLMQNAHEEFIELKINCVGVLKSILRQGQKEGIFNKNLDLDACANLLEAMFTGVAFISSMVKNIKSGLIQEFNMENMISFAMDFFYLGITNTKTEICK
jgi:TetR/AcrR family fatty acid metabolism transcriptional regulator